MRHQDRRQRRQGSRSCSPWRRQAPAQMNRPQARIQASPSSRQAGHASTPTGALSIAWMLAKSAAINPDIGSVAAMMEKHITQEQEVGDCAFAAKMENDNLARTSSGTPAPRLSSCAPLRDARRRRRGGPPCAEKPPTAPSRASSPRGRSAARPRPRTGTDRPSRRRLGLASAGSSRRQAARLGDARTASPLFKGKGRRPSATRPSPTWRGCAAGRRRCPWRRRRDRRGAGRAAPAGSERRKGRPRASRARARSRGRPRRRPRRR